jgi:hypothetical protein
MTSELTSLLVECKTCGVRLALAGYGGLAIDAPQDALTPDLLDRLKTHKAELLAMLRPAPDAARIDPSDAAAVWQAALDQLEGDPMFPPAMMESLRSAKARWANEEPHADTANDPAPALTCNAPPKPAKAVCRCGGTTWRDVPIHGGQSIRRDCGGCGRFLDFPLWYGKDAGHNGQ